MSLEERADSFLRLARAWCLERAKADTSATSAKVPARHPTDDPTERWSLAKVIRRHAEHLWEHLGTIAADIASLQLSRGKPGSRMR
jgi:hypothetical protein